jgi:hypothetical protein
MKLNTNLISSKSTIINAKPNKVWETLTNPSLISQYLFGAKTVTDWQPNNTIQFIINFDNKEFIDKGIVIENIQNETLKYKYWSGFCGLEDLPENYSIVCYSIEKIENNKCKLTWTQTGFVDEQSRTSSENSLLSILEQIKSLAEQ